MSDYVLDSSAVLALLFQEKGMELIERILDRSIIGRVNESEILTKLVARGSSISEASDELGELKLAVAELNEIQSRKIAELRPPTKHLGLSLGDRACLALAIQENATAVTADRIWKDLDVCKIEVIR